MGQINFQSLSILILIVSAFMEWKILKLEFPTSWKSPFLRKLTFVLLWLLYLSFVFVIFCTSNSHQTSFIVLQILLIIRVVRYVDAKHNPIQQETKEMQMTGREINIIDNDTKYHWDLIGNFYKVEHSLGRTSVLTKLGEDNYVIAISYPDKVNTTIYHHSLTKILELHHIFQSAMYQSHSEKP